jgi:hypothetical protein
LKHLLGMLSYLLFVETGLVYLGLEFLWEPLEPSVLLVDHHCVGTLPFRFLKIILITLSYRALRFQAHDLDYI